MKGKREEEDGEDGENGMTGGLGICFEKAPKGNFGHFPKMGGEMLPVAGDFNWMSLIEISLEILGLIMRTQVLFVLF